MDQINIQIVKKLREMVRQEMEEGGAVFATKDGLPHLEYDPEKEKKDEAVQVNIDNLLKNQKIKNLMKRLGIKKTQSETGIMKILNYLASNPSALSALKVAVGESINEAKAKAGDYVKTIFGIAQIEKVRGSIAYMKLPNKKSKGYWMNDLKNLKATDKKEKGKDLWTEDRDYKAEYKKYGSSTKAKKYRAELNKYNRQRGTYGNGDKKDASHKGGKIVGFEEESKNRGRREKSRLKKESATVNESAVSFWQDMFRPGPIPKKYIIQLIKKKGELPSKSHIKRIYKDNGNPSSSELAKTWKLLQKEKYVRAASGMWRWNSDFTGWESIDESGLQYRMGVKRYGKEGMSKIQSAAGKGLGHAEIGAIKDKYDKKKKKKKESVSVDEISSKTKRELMNSFENYQELEDFVDKYEKHIPKNLWRKINFYLDDIRDEEQGMKEPGWADPAKKGLKVILTKYIRESILKEHRYFDLGTSKTVNAGIVTSTGFDKDKNINEFSTTPPSYSSTEAQKHVDRDVTTMSKFLGKASQQVIKTMMDGVKGGRYDAMDLQRGLQYGPVKRTHYGEDEFLQQLWRKVRDGFRRYSKRGKLR